FKEINMALASGRIGALSWEEKEQLRDFIISIRPDTDLGNILINAPPSRHTLNVYSVDSSVESKTSLSFWKRGNAVYDARADAIFLDASIVKLALGTLEGREYTGLSDPFRLYLEFMILHELGHRRLHAGAGGLFDGEGVAFNKKLVRQEEQADDFAFRQ